MNVGQSAVSYQLCSLWPFFQWVLVNGRQLLSCRCCNSLCQKIVAIATTYKALVDVGQWKPSKVCVLLEVVCVHMWKDQRQCSSWIASSRGHWCCLYGNTLCMCRVSIKHKCVSRHSLCACVSINIHKCMYSTLGSPPLSGQCTLPTNTELLLKRMSPPITSWHTSNKW